MNTLKIHQLIGSKTNATGRTEGKAFEDLVASVREKGILVPVLARKTKSGLYEVIAGNRRLAAAKVANLPEVPVNIVEMNDMQAREAQIVENLQRQDIHPLDEGQLYRALIEKSKPRYEVKDVAIKVGKSETYVRQRLAITNLSPRATKMFIAGKLTPAIAVLIARIESTTMQDKVISEAGEYRLSDSDRVREIIQNFVYLDLNKKPWAKDAKLAEMVGDKVGHESLFGDKTAGTDPVAYAQQMAAYIEIQVRKFKEKGQELVKICTQYGEPDVKGALRRDSYRMLNSKEEIKESLTKKKAIVVEGENLGQIYWIATDGETKGQYGLYKQTPAEKAEAKKLRDKEKLEKENKDKKILAGMKKVKWPMSQKHLDILYGIVFRRFGFSYLQPVAKRHGIKADKVKTSWGTQRDIETPVKKHFDALGNTGKLQFIMEIGLEASGGIEDALKKI